MEKYFRVCYTNKECYFHKHRRDPHGGKIFTGKDTCGGEKSG